MKLDEQYWGTSDGFEGDRTLWLRSLPTNAQVTRALVTLKPALTPEEKLFEETIIFPEGSASVSQGNWGATKSQPSGTKFVEVDFHARRTLTGVKGTSLNGATLQIDMGGTYVDVSDRGTIKGQNDSAFTFNNDSNQQMPGLTVTKFKLTAANQPDITQVTVRTVPTNISVRVGQLPSFWTRPGELTIEATSPDFTTVLNTVLLSATAENGFYAIPFTIHSDSFTRLDVRVQIDYVLTQRALPSYLPEATLSYDLNTVPIANESLTQVSLPEGAIPVQGQTNALIRGEFKPTRIALGPVGKISNSLPILVSPDCSLAQPIYSDNDEISVTGIDLLFDKTQPALAGLNVSIQSDEDGKPSGEVLVSADVIVGKPLPPEEFSWGSATLPKPFRVLKGIRYWLVLQSQIGQACWQSQPDAKAEIGLQCRSAQVPAWRTVTVVGETAPLAALFRLRNLPDRFTVPLHLQIGREPAVVRRLSEFDPLGRVEFQFDFSKQLVEYLNQSLTQSGCGKGNLLVNGEFREPPCDDATLKLFDLSQVEQTTEGITTKQDEQETERSEARQRGYFQRNVFISYEFKREIDLSVARYIVLGVSDRKPIRIDCAGRNPARTTVEEIVSAINSAMGAEVARFIGRGQTQFQLSWPMYQPGYYQTLTLRLYLWCSTKIPTGWQGTTGSVLRLKVPDKNSDRIAMLLVNPALLNVEPIHLHCFPASIATTNTSTSDDISLFQRVTCRAGCTYLLQFIYGILSSQQLTISPAKWQVVWLNQAGDTIRIDEENLDPIDLKNATNNTEKGANKSLSQFYEVRVTAPPDTAQAEIRFVQPSPGGLWLESVALIPTIETLSNPRFVLQADEELLHWQRVSGSVEPKPANGSQSTEEVMLILSGNESDDTVLTQVTEVVAGGNYQLQVNARLQSPPASNPEMQPLQQRSRVELHWLGNGVLNAPITTLPLDGSDFPGHIWAGTAPTGATQVEIRLIQPKGQSNLLVQSVSLLRMNQLPIPLIFLSEAPGELTISNLQVTYDIPEPPALLKPPTKPVALLTPDPSPTPTPPPSPPPLRVSSPAIASDPIPTPSPAPTPPPTPTPTPPPTPTPFPVPTPPPTPTPTPPPTPTPSPPPTPPPTPTPTPPPTPPSTSTPTLPSTPAISKQPLASEADSLPVPSAKETSTEERLEKASASETKPRVVAFKAPPSTTELSPVANSASQTRVMSGDKLLHIYVPSSLSTLTPVSGNSASQEQPPQGSQPSLDSPKEHESDQHLGWSHILKNILHRD